ncbi:O-succinylbenzoic acid--CoA ligase [Flagellimonas aquimarina]|uniref:O-succinylbenzoic acid--CoA ligase n=1 Tax=Flagellimonas aquimarina TaxID=2201895 RepID=A0A316KZN3_9FLAO|nr:AMP-binding protein [Allomuricauda koreensis]PWL39076.1 O-succinylbenzoic acid--CoA ligase [Allomuricauda koreensis]
MNLIWHRIHPSFKLNGVHYSYNELLEIGYSLVKEGAPYQKSIGEFMLDWSADKPTLEVYTSGSTGKPKKIVLKKEHMVNSAMATGKYFSIGQGDTALLCLPCTGIAGKMMLVRAMVLGMEIDCEEPSSTPLAKIQTNYDFAAMVPLQVENSLDQLSQIATLIIGGAAIAKSLKEKLELVSNMVFETYGMTETITHIAVKRLNEHVSDSFELLPNINVSTDDRDCLVISAPHISDDKVVTNDIVELMGDRQFRWIGRYDSIINSGGIKLVPEQIELKLSSIIHSRFFVAGMPDKKLGQKLVLFVEEGRASKTELFEKMKTLKELTKYEIPKEIHSLTSFIETESGKIDRKKTLLQLGEVL